MHFWIVTIGEPLPKEGASDRLHRSGMLSRYLTSHGHRVTWWGSTFDHFSKRHLYDKDSDFQITKDFRMVLFHGTGYKRNVSIQRMNDHRVVAKKFAAAVRQEKERPDVILCSFPTIELSKESVKYGKQRGVPVILDVRDLWPDIFVGAAPAPLRSMGKALLFPLFHQTRYSFRGCHGILGISPGYLDWALKYAGRLRRETDAVFPLGYKKSVEVGEISLGAASNLSGIGVDYSKLIIWFIGTFGRTYDLAPVIEVARRFSEEKRDGVQFVLSGSGEDDSKYRLLAEGMNNVVFTGWINEHQISQMMKVTCLGLAAYAAGAPQGLPNKLFEYLSAGIPIVSSLAGEAEEFLSRTKTGENYRAGDGGSLYETLVSLLKQPEMMKAMGNRGREIFEKEYSADVIYPRIIAHLGRQAVNVRPPGMVFVPSALIEA